MNFIYFIKKMSLCLFLIIIAGFVLLFSDGGNLNSGGKNGNLKTGMLKFVIIEYSDAPISEESRAGILDGLSANGFKADRDYVLRSFKAHGDVTVLNGIIDSAASLNCDIIFTISTPALQAALKKIKNVPIVFASAGDPIGAGAGKSFTDHAENVTGISSMSDFEGMINVLKETMPEAKKIGTIFTPSEINSVFYKNEFEKAAKKNNIELVAVPVTASSEIIEASMNLCSKNIAAICQIVDNITAPSFATIVKTASNSKIPVLGFGSTNVKDGAILAYARDYHQCGADAAKLAVRILKGERPANIPFEYISKTDLSINKKAFKANNITLKSELLKKAVKVLGE